MRETVSRDVPRATVAPPVYIVVDTAIILLFGHLRRLVPWAKGLFLETLCTGGNKKEERHHVHIINTYILCILIFIVKRFEDL